MFLHGKDHPRAVLTWDEIEFMRQCHDAGLPVVTIAKRFERPRRTVRSVLTYKTWTTPPTAVARRLQACLLSVFICLFAGAAYAEGRPVKRANAPPT